MNVQPVDVVGARARLEVDHAAKLDQLARVGADEGVEEGRLRRLAANIINSSAHLKPGVGGKVEAPQVAKHCRERHAAEHVNCCRQRERGVGGGERRGKEGGRERH